MSRVKSIMQLGCGLPGLIWVGRLIAVAVVCALFAGAEVSAQNGGGAQSARTLNRGTINFSEIASRPAPAGALAPVSGKAGVGNPRQGKAPTSPLASDSFQGLRDNLQYIPPDTHGAVGTNYLVAVGNGSVQIQARSGAVVSLTTLDNFWSSVLPNVSLGTFDPKILYDATRDRFIFTACYAGFDTNSSVLIGVSATGDPTGNWFLYRIQADATGLLWADYPSIGFNRNWVVVTMNMFTIAAGAFDHANVYIFDKANLMAGGATANNTLDANPSPQRFTLVPTVNMDPTPEMYLIQNANGAGAGNNGVLTLYAITGRVGFETVNQRGNMLIPGAWEDFPISGAADFAPQLGLPVLIQNNDARMQNAVLRNGTLWCTHHIFLPAGGGRRTAVQWFQILPFGPGFLFQRGRIDDPTGQRFFAFPSIAVNRLNDVLIGYSTFSTNQFASAGYSYRRITDVPNTMQPDQMLKPGEGPYYKTFGGPDNRWGDYSMTMVDPLNDIDMWTIQEYAAAPFGNPSVVDSGRWGTWWGRVAGPTVASGALTVRVAPPAGSVLLGGGQVPIQVTVSDSAPITNAVVRGSVLVPGGITNVVFANDGVAPDTTAGDNIYTLVFNVPNLVSNTIDLTVDVSAPGKVDASVTVTYVVQSPPPNDMFANAIRISDAGGSVQGDNTFATFEPGEPLHARSFDATNSVWWYWSPPNNLFPTNSGLVLVDTLGTKFNNVVAVYAGNNVSNLVELVSADDTATPVGLRRQPFVYFNATNGATYRIAIAGVTSADFGAITLRVEPNGIPDTNAPTVAITSPKSGVVTKAPVIIVTGTASDTGPGASGISTVLLTVNGGAPITAVGTNNWSVQVLLSPGTNIIQAVALDNAQNRSAPAFISVKYLVLNPPNDLFALPVWLTNTADLLVVNTTNATSEVGEPVHCGKAGGKSVWFNFRPSQNGVLDINTFNSTFDTLMAIYTGDYVYRLSLVSSNDNVAPGLTYSALSQPVIGGQTYHIAVDGLDATSGFLQLQYVFTPASVVNVSITNIGAGTVDPPGNLYRASIVTQFMATASLNNDFVLWQGSVNSLQNPLVLTLVSNIQLQAIFLPHDFSDDFESGRLSKLGWTNNPGTTPWFVQTNEVSSGLYAVRSGLVGNSSTSSLALTATFRDGPGSFAFRVSSEPYAWRDYFTFLIDGVAQTNVWGESGWQRYSFWLGAGTHKLEWRYQKDATFTGGLDGAFVDEVELPLVVPKTNSTPALLSRFGTSSGNPELRLRGQTNQVYLIQGSTDLSNWQTIATNIAVHGYILFRDPEPSDNYNARYYRAIVP